MAPAKRTVQKDTNLMTRRVGVSLVPDEEVDVIEPLDILLLSGLPFVERDVSPTAIVAT